MKSLPKYRAERIRLLAHLERQKQLIHDDMESIKEALKPVAIAKQMISDAADSFRDNNLATQATRLALTVLPGRLRHPVVGIAAQIALPLLARNAPKLFHLLKNRHKDNSDISASIANAEEEVPGRVKFLGGMRNAVSKLRQRIRK